MTRHCPNAFTMNYPVELVGVECAQALHDALARPDHEENPEAKALAAATYPLALSAHMTAEGHTCCERHLDLLFDQGRLCDVCQEVPWTQQARFCDAQICTDCAQGEPDPDPPEEQPMREPRFVVCHCDAVYPKPQTGACPLCEDPSPAWNDWHPGDEDGPDLRDLPDLIVGLLMLLEDRGDLQDHAGRLYGAVRDALVAVAHLQPPPFEDFYTQEVREG